jgi:isocitrate dehydrogenase
MGEGQTQKVTVAYGDGIGPEIMKSTVAILEAAGAPLELERIEIGKEVYERGVTTGIPDEAWDAIYRNKVLLKAPITTPQGGGYKSLNVTIRKTLGLYANVRQTRAYAPYVVSHHPGMDLVIVRENEEDLYAGIEHRQTQEVAQVLKLITWPGSERVIRYAFEYARAHGRDKVTCMTKDNIMKHTDGLFHRVFDEVAAEYEDITSEHQIIDIGSARVAAQPESLDVVVTLNLYGDILSDIAAQIAGSVGLAGSANIGDEAAMFEAVHGSAPDIAGKGVANPSGLLTAAVQMLVHLGLPECAQKIKNAWLVTLEEGIHTADIYREGLSARTVGTEAFTEAVIERLGRTPKKLRPAQYQATGAIHVEVEPRPLQEKTLVGVDAFLDWVGEDRNPDTLGAGLEALAGPEFALHMIASRGVKVYPAGFAGTFKADHWRCRFVPERGDEVTNADIVALLGRLDKGGYDVIKTENLYTFDGERGYSLAQGE